MKTRIIITAVLSALLACSSAGAEDNNADKGKATGSNIIVKPEKKLAKINDLFWGTNFLFWIEDDQALADGKIAKSLADLPCTMLRYPGGTIADNFHWETNMLDNKFMFPYEEGPDQSDFEEFMVFCLKLGAEPIIVVNTQSWFLKNDIEGGAQEASRWVRHCKDKGYKVKYWEIGNETYWHPVMTAKEYGRLVNVYSKAMKSVDPSIIVSANGHWDINMSGTKERVDPALWDKMRQMYLDIKSTEDYKALTKFIEASTVKPITTGKDKWWNDLIDVCGDNIDMISIHWYFHNNMMDKVDKKINELKAFIKNKRPDKDYLYALTEYNCNTEGVENRVVGLAEGIGRLLNSGFDMSCIWPLRIGGNPGPKGNRNLLALESKNEQYPIQIFKLFSDNLKGDMVVSQSAKELFSFASHTPQQTTVVVSGERIEGASTPVVLDAGRNLSGADIAVNSYAAAADQESVRMDSTPLVWKIVDGKLTFEMKKGTFVMVTVKER